MSISSDFLFVVDEVGGGGAAECRELPVSIECPVVTSAHQSTLSIKRAVYRTSSANASRDYTETDISGRVMELCPRQSTACRFDLAARDVTGTWTNQRAGVGRYHDNHIDVSYACQSAAAAIIQPTDYNYKPQRPPSNIDNYYYYLY